MRILDIRDVSGEKARVTNIIYKNQLRLMVSSLLGGNMQ